jgi:CubicO group peptidase (beta-lactamase class C family)
MRSHPFPPCLRRAFVSHVLAALLLACGVVSAPASAQPAGVSAERLARLRLALQRHVDAGEMAGLVALMVRDGQVVAHEALGYADAGRRVAMRPDAIFRLASMTKPVTSVAILMLFEEGRLLLTDPVALHLPEFAAQQVAVLDATGRQIVELVPAQRPITIRDLLTHRSGLTYAFLNDGALGDLYRAAGITDGQDVDGTAADNIRRVAAQPLLFQPGTRYQYSLSTDVLGRVVEVVSDMTLADFFAERIFAPLGMRETVFYVADADLHRLTVPYVRQDGRLRAMANPELVGSLLYAGEGHRGNATFHSGGGGLLSTAADFARFAQMLLNGGELDGARILSRKMVELMLADHVADLDPHPGGGTTAVGYATAAGKAEVVAMPSVNHPLAVPHSAARG